MNEELELNKVCEGSELQNKDLKWESPKSLKPNWISRWIPLREMGETPVNREETSWIAVTHHQHENPEGEKWRTDIVADHLWVENVQQD